MDEISHFLDLLSKLGPDVMSRLKSAGEVTVVHHDDADGITSAAILEWLLDENNIDSKLICLEKTFPQILSRLESEEGVLVYLDLGSPHAKLISKLNRGRDFIMILDHHDPEKVDDPKILNINPELYGISGESEASASAVVYALVRAIIGEAKGELAKLALIGAAEIPGEIAGLNELALRDALSAGLVKRRALRRRIDYAVVEGGRLISRSELSKRLTILGSVGYYRNGPQMALKACLEGFSPAISSLYKKLEEERKRLYREALTRLREGGFHTTTNVQWFHLGDLFLNVGSKVLGTFASYVMHRGMSRRDKYLVGFMHLNPKIPGLGELEGEYSKVSVRTPDQLAAMIRSKRMPSSAEVLSHVCSLLGGFGDGHDYAASGIIPRGRERELIRRMNRRVEQYAAKSKKGRTSLDEFF